MKISLWFCFWLVFSPKKHTSILSSKDWHYHGWTLDYFIAHKVRNTLKVLATASDSDRLQTEVVDYDFQDLSNVLLA